MAHLLTRWCIYDVYCNQGAEGYQDVLALLLESGHVVHLRQCMDIYGGEAAASRTSRHGPL